MPIGYLTEGFCGLFFSQASAALGTATTQIAGATYRHVSAFAQAFPKRAFDARWVLGSPNNGQATVTLIGKVNEFWAWLCGMIGGHREPPVLGVKPRDDSQSSPWQLYWGWYCFILAHLVEKHKGLFNTYELNALDDFSIVGV